MSFKIKKTNNRIIMNRYYFYKRNKNISENYKGDLIYFSLSALYSEKVYSQNQRKEVFRFSFFDQIKVCISTKTSGIFQVDYNSGTDGCMSSGTKSLKELKENFVKDGYILICERNYFQLRKLAIRLIIQKIKFFTNTESDTMRNFFYKNSWSKSFYDIKLFSTSEKKNLRNYPQSTIALYKENGWKLMDLRIDEEYRVFLSKDRNYKTNSFRIESSHFNSYYENLESFKTRFSSYAADKVIKDFQFDRLKKIVNNLIFDRLDLDISSILPKQTHSVLLLD